jgi:hypothetical protein
MKNEPLRACVTTVEDDDHGALLQVKFDTSEAAHRALSRLQDIETLRERLKGGELREPEDFWPGGRPEHVPGGGKVLTLDPTGGEWIVRTNRQSFRLSDLIALAYDIDQAQGVNPIREAVIDVGAYYSGAVNAQFLHDSTVEQVAVETYKDSAVYVGRYQCGLCKEKDAT